MAIKTDLPPSAQNKSNYHSSVEKPEDFDAFWAGVEAAADSIPLNASLRPDSLRSTESVEVFEVHYDSLDHVRIAGWYCLPRERSDPLPTVVAYPGYISEPSLPKNWAEQGYAAFGAAPRGKLRSNRQYNPGYPGLLIDNIVDRNTYSYRGFYADAWRVIDFLISRPEIDDERIGVTGGSQGGALTLVAASMRPDKIRAAAASAPYLSGMMDAASLTHSYPYEEINEYLHLYPEREEDVRQTLAYFDCHNFVERIRCPIIVAIGLQDNICPPETGFNVFDRIGSEDKALYPYDGAGHDANSFQHSKVVSEFFASHL